MDIPHTPTKQLRTQKRAAVPAGRQEDLAPGVVSTRRRQVNGLLADRERLVVGNPDALQQQSTQV